MAPISRMLALGACLAISSACSLHKAPPDPAPTLLLDQASFRMVLPVDPNGLVRLTDQAPLLGTFDASPLLKAEGRSTESVQVILHLGILYLTADGFRNLWEVTPQQGTRRATYRPIRLPDGAESSIRLSRYGPPGQACLRLDGGADSPWFLNADGALSAHCP